MTKDFRRAQSALTTLSLLAGLQGLTGCANFPYVAGEAKGVKEQAELQTGSNLARRGQAGTGTREADKDAIESSLRGTNANRDNGK